MRTVIEHTSGSSNHVREMLFYNKAFSMIYWSVLLSYFVVKFLIRPIVLENISNQLLHIFVLSYPNFCEAVIGSFVLVNGLRYVNQIYISRRYRLKRITISLLGHSLAAVYVITQELKIHNLGGANVYDPYDVLFSVIGILTSYYLFQRITFPLDTRLNHPQADYSTSSQGS